MVVEGALVLPKVEVGGLAPVVARLEVPSGVARSEGVVVEVGARLLEVARRWMRRGWLLVLRCFGICCSPLAVVSVLVSVGVVEQQREAVAGEREEQTRRERKESEARKMVEAALERQGEEALKERRLRTAS